MLRVIASLSNAVRVQELQIEVANVSRDAAGLATCAFLLLFVQALLCVHTQQCLQQMAMSRFSFCVPGVRSAESAARVLEKKCEQVGAGSSHVRGIVLFFFYLVVQADRALKALQKKMQKEAKEREEGLSREQTKRAALISAHDASLAKVRMAPKSQKCEYFCLNG